MYRDQNEFTCWTCLEHNNDYKTINKKPVYKLVLMSIMGTLKKKSYLYDISIITNKEYF